MAKNNQRPVKPFSLLIKPTSADCNMVCDYCFYLKKYRIYPETKRHRMNDEVLERIVSSYMSTPQPVYYFGWQGGEPTLMGLDFFARVVELQKKYGRRGAVVSNGIQTNGTLIGDSLAALFSKYKFLVGVSIDGPQELHDRYRTHKKGQGSHADVLDGVASLQKHKVEINALVLVSSSNVGHPKEVYRYLTDLEIYHHQYIPCVEFNRKGQPRSFAISGNQWGDFLCGLFDEWIKNDTRRVSIRLFDSIMGHMLDWQYRMCIQGGRCDRYFLVEHNGDVYPCDFFVDENKKLGNITAGSWESLCESAKYRSFGGQKANWSYGCKICSILRYCGGDCLKHRFYRDKCPESISWLCAGWKKFYRHSLPSFEKIALSFLNERQIAYPFQKRTPFNKLPTLDIGKKDHCFCGSERKFKHCHGHKD